MRLDVQNICVDFRDTPAIFRSLSLTVGDGEFMSLLGPSGCGKSTLLKTVAGIQPMRSGRILIGGRDVSALPVHKRGAVVVFQDIRLFPNMTVAENVAFPLRAKGVAKDERMREAERLLEKVQMAGCGERRISEISGGQQQRTALARALAARPHLLLLDEPFSSLDENLREDMRALVMKLHADFGMTTLLVTHDRAEALTMSDRVALMFDGEIVQTGTPQEVYSRPACRRAADYFGDCVYLRGSVADGVFSSPYLSCPVEAEDSAGNPLSGGEYDMMLRSDALNTETDGGYAVTVQSVRFQGERTAVIFKSEDGHTWRKELPSPVPWVEGQTVRCTLSAGQKVLFRAESTGQK